VRGVSVNGNHEKYRSDLNYQPGLRTFNASFLIEDNTNTQYKLFDSALITNSGWGADPQGEFRLNMDKTGIYKFDSNARRVRYFNNLNTHAINWSPPVANPGSEHAADTLHHFGDFDLTVFPERENFRMRFGYSFSATSGPGFSTIRFSGDEYQVDSDVDNDSQDIRAGVEGKLLGFNIGGLYGHRAFEDKNRFFVNTLNIGNNPATSTSFINTMYRLLPVKGTTDFVNFWLQRTFARRFDLTAHFVYALTSSHSKQSDSLQGRASSTGNFIVNDMIDVMGDAKRPQARGDLGMTWNVTKRFRVSNTFIFDQFNIDGLERFFEFNQTVASNGFPNSAPPTDTTSSTGTSYRRFSNLIEADYQVNRAFSFNAGWRYTHRNVSNYLFEINNTTGSLNQNQPPEEFDNTTHSLIAGARVKPSKDWSIFADLEWGDADNVFTRLANNQFFNFRIRSVARLKRFTLNASYIAKNNDSPGTSEPVTSSGGFPATETIASTKSNIFSASVDWEARDNISVSSGYTYTHQTSTTDIIVPVGVPVRTSTAFFLGLSQYFVRDSYFWVDVNARLMKRVGLFVSYRIDTDGGQGDLRIMRPQDIVSSYPFTFHQPEARLAVKLTKNIDWNLGYQYYSYSEKQYPLPFTSINSSTLIPKQIANQNYTAHLPYTSLTFYFGRSAQDR